MLDLCPTAFIDKPFLLPAQTFYILSSANQRESPMHLQDDMFVPSMETVKRKDSFLTENPFDLLKSGNFQRVPWIVGVTAGEGGLKTSRVEVMSELENVDKKWSEYAPVLFHYDPAKSEVTKKLRQFYFGSKTVEEDRDEFLRNLTRMLSDGIFFHPTHKAALMHSKYAPTYLYLYNYTATTPSTYSVMRAITPETWVLAEAKMFFHSAQDFVKKYFNHPGPHNYGPCHADDLFQQWDMNSLMEIIHRNYDYEFSKTFIKSFVDFAAGVEDLEFGSVPWLASQPKPPLLFMHMDTSATLILDPFYEIIPFWDSLEIRNPNETVNW